LLASRSISPKPKETQSPKRSAKESGFQIPGDGDYSRLDKTQLFNGRGSSSRLKEDVKNYFSRFEVKILLEQNKDDKKKLINEMKSLLDRIKTLEAGISPKSTFLSVDVTKLEELSERLSADKKAQQGPGPPVKAREAWSQSTSVKRRKTAPVKMVKVIKTKSTIKFDGKRYTELKEIGRGAFGIVYLAKDESGNKVAFKRIPKPTIDKQSKEKTVQEQKSAKGEHREDVKTEYLIQSQLRHDNIVKIDGCGASDVAFYFKMEYFDGEELFSKIESGALTPTKITPEDEEFVKYVIEQLIALLIYIVSNDVTHADIKPENIRVDSTGKIKLMDFGLSVLLPKNPQKPRLTHSYFEKRQMFGTPEYLPKSVWRGINDKNVHKMDQFALAVVLLELKMGDRVSECISTSQRLKLDTDPWAYIGSCRRKVEELWSALDSKDPHKEIIGKLKDGIATSQDLSNTLVKLAKVGTKKKRAEVGTKKKRAEVGTKKKRAEVGTKKKSAEVRTKKKGAKMGPKEKGAKMRTQKKGAKMGPKEKGAKMGPQEKGTKMRPKKKGAKMGPQKKGAKIRTKEKGGKNA